MTPGPQGAAWFAAVRGDRRSTEVDRDEVVAAVGVAGPVTRLSKKALSGYLPHVMETAAAISARLGHRGKATI